MHSVACQCRCSDLELLYTEVSGTGLVFIYFRPISRKKDRKFQCQIGID